MLRRGKLNACLGVTLFVFALGLGPHCPASGAAANLGVTPLGRGTHVSALTSGPEGKLWFAGVTPGSQGPSGVVGSVGVDGQLREFPLPFPGAAEGIAVGPDGNLWFTNPPGNAIGRISPAGQLEEYRLHLTGARPTAIVEGPDEAMWYSEPGASAVGWFQTERIQDFSLVGGSAPGGIVVGPDHAVWVAETGASRIARIVEGVPPQEFQLPDPTARPERIVVGPDGALWFTENGASAIGRITLDGQVTEFPVPGNAGTSQISRGPGDVLWYSNRDGGIGSITTEGQTARPECPLESCRYPIAALTRGPDGALWFGTGVYNPEGGGGEGALAYSQASLVGKFSPAPVEAEIGPRAGLIHGRTMTIPLRCEGGVAGTSCEGVVRLYRHRSLIALRNYRLLTESGRRVTVRFSRRVARQLKSGRHVWVWVTATAGGGKADRRKLALRPF